MKTFLTRIVSDLRVWLGWDDSSTGRPEERLTPRFGWLLPQPSLLVAQRIPPEQQLPGPPEGSWKPRG